MKLKSSAILCLMLLLTACSLFEKKEPGIPVARVNNAILYLDELESVIPEGVSENDSILRATNYINQWATEQLFMDGAIVNLSEEKQSEFEKLVDQYQSDLYIKAYLEALVKQKIDTSVSESEAQETYAKNLESFKLNDELIKFRYINIPESNSDKEDIEERLKRFNDEDKRVLDSIAIQFTSYSLNDSIWIKATQAIDKIPILKTEKKEELLKKSNFIQLKDSLGLYLMQIKDVLLRNETAPIEYVMPTIKQIVINKRKLEFIKQLEKDITKDAIKNKQFEIYN